MIKHTGWVTVNGVKYRQLAVDDNFLNNYLYCTNKVLSPTADNIPHSIKEELLQEKKQTQQVLTIKE